MGDVPQFVLFEHADGYYLFRVREFENIGLALTEVQKAVTDVQRFCSAVKMEAFHPFQNTEVALESMTKINEGQLPEDLINFLEANLPRQKKKQTKLGVIDPRLAGAINETFSNSVKCQHSSVVLELLRGVRTHFEKLISKSTDYEHATKARLSLGHSFSRAKVKHDIHRVDNMVIQSIALLDQLDKDINLFGMRIREWYSYHFPELYRIVPEQFNYVKCASLIMNRSNLDEAVIESLKGILDDEEKVAEVEEAARKSMGMDIAEIDLHNINHFTRRINALLAYRVELQNYIKERMHSCAPSLSELIGEQVGARLISHAGSLSNLAKCPASTVQILGAEKALFRALKTRSNTPKYGLLFHSSYIGRAAAKDKGRISRFLANKCAVASRVDCFADVPVAAFGKHLKQQLEDRLMFLQNGTVPRKNIEVMHDALADAEREKIVILKKRKKEAKKAKKRAAEQQSGLEANENLNKTTETNKDVEGGKSAVEIPKKKATKHKLKADYEAANETVEHDESAAEPEVKSKRKKGASSNIEEVENPQENGDLLENAEESSKKKKKKKKHKEEEAADSFVADNEELVAPVSGEEDKPKKKKRKHSLN